MLALSSPDQAVALLASARSGFAASLTGFEPMAGVCLRMVTRTYPAQRLPFEGPSAAAPWYALLEISDAESEAHARERFEVVLGDAIAAGEADDAVVAENITQSKALWHLRESITSLAPRRRSGMRKTWRAARKPKGAPGLLTVKAAAPSSRATPREA